MTILAAFVSNVTQRAKVYVLSVVNMHFTGIASILGVLEPQHAMELTVVLFVEPRWSNALKMQHLPSTIMVPPLIVRLNRT